MAFVNQSKRNLNNPNTNLSENLGPGAYIGHKEYTFTRSAAPFNSVIQREFLAKEKHPVPGPGAYNQESGIIQGQKVVLSSGNSTVKILEVPKPQSNFKSSTKRFQETKADPQPGPGTYLKQKEEQIHKPRIESQGNIIQHLMEINHYQPIPSIPVKHQLYGYTEKNNNELELNKSPVPTFKGIKDDIIGPGQYTLKDTFTRNKDKASNFHKSKVPRMASVSQGRGGNGVGPGQYDHCSEYVPLYKLRPSVGFQSKSQRGFDQRRGQVAQQFLMERVAQSHNKYKLEANEQESEEIEFIDDTTPGPGHYNPNSSTAASISQSQMRRTGISDSAHAFGSQVQRFKEDAKFASSLGPGNYNVQGSLAKSCSAIKHPPFMASNTRFESKLLQNVPGPQTYDPKLTLEDKLIGQIQRGPLGNFGSNQIRFGRSQLQQDPPGPGQYDHQRPWTQGDQPAAFFKSKTIRDPFMAEINYPPPGAYQVENYTIEKNTRIEKEDDIDLAIKKPPFNSSVNRFNEKKEIKTVTEDLNEDEYNTNGKNINELFHKKQEKTVPFNVKANRFNYYNNKVLDEPGPGQYHNNKSNPWNKRTYNILFAEL